MVVPELTLDSAFAPAVLRVPGGPGARDVTVEWAAVEEFVRARRADAEIVAGVCTGAYVLAGAGLLDGRRASTHSACFEEFARQFPKASVVADQVVRDGCVLTSRGASNGIDLALYPVEQYAAEGARLIGQQSRRHPSYRDAADSG